MRCCCDGESRGHLDTAVPCVECVCQPGKVEHGCVSVGTGHCRSQCERCTSRLDRYACECGGACSAARKAVGAAGGIVHTVAAMARHAGNPHLQRLGCAVFQNVTAGECGIHREGGTSCTDKRLTCDVCCEAGITGNAEAIVAAGGIECVIAAMGGHTSDSRVQQAGCNALRNLTVGVARACEHS